MSLRSSRASTQSTTPFTMRLLPSRARNDDLFVARVTTEIDDELLEPPRRRPRDDVAAQVVGAVVARAPELRGVRLVLDGAIEVRAHRAEGADVAFGGADDDAGAAAELEDVRAVRWERRRLAGAGARGCRLAAGRRNQELRDRIGDRDGGRHEADRQQRIEESAAIECGAGPHRDRVRGDHLFLSDDRYATSASTSSFGNVNSFIAGLRVALVLAVIPLASVIQDRISAAESLATASSSGPLGLPFPAIEWHNPHFCAANTASPFAVSCAATDAAPARLIITTHVASRSMRTSTRELGRVQLPTVRLHASGHGATSRENAHVGHSGV